MQNVGISHKHMDLLNFIADEIDRNCKATIKEFIDLSDTAYTLFFEKENFEVDTSMFYAYTEQGFINSISIGYSSEIDCMTITLHLNL